MPAHPHLPRPQRRQHRRLDLLSDLVAVDNSPNARARILKMESDFRSRIDQMNRGLPLSTSRFERFNTNPYVLLMHAEKQQYRLVSQIERDIVPAKVFSSIETAAGRMVEDITLPQYGWSQVPSAMHSPGSALDGMRLVGGVGEFVSLKSGPRCLNDEMSENFADAILSHSPQWAQTAGVSDVRFTYGTLYGTPRNSNKKDWHILRNLVEKAPAYSATVHTDARKRWYCRVKLGRITVTATVRIGTDWWEHLGGKTCALEVWVAMIRACILPSASQSGIDYRISDMADIVSVASVPSDYNVSLLQSSQLRWLFLVARHFCDDLL